MPCWAMRRCLRIVTGVEATWTLITPVLEAWKKNPVTDFPNYAAGTWGPGASDAMLRADGQKWRKL